jgi:hypothetical protein
LPSIASISSSTLALSDSVLASCFLILKFSNADAYCAFIESILCCDDFRFSDARPATSPAALPIAAFSFPLCHCLIPISNAPVTAAAISPGIAPAPPTGAVAAPPATAPATDATQWSGIPKAP